MPNCSNCNRRLKYIGVEHDSATEETYECPKCHRRALFLERAFIETEQTPESLAKFAARMAETYGGNLKLDVQIKISEEVDYITGEVVPRG